MDIAALLAGLPARQPGSGAAGTAADGGPAAEFPHILEAIATLRAGGIDAEALREMLAQHGSATPGPRAIDAALAAEGDGELPPADGTEAEEPGTVLAAVFPGNAPPATVSSADAAATGDGDRVPDPRVPRTGAEALAGRQAPEPGTRPANAGTGDGRPVFSGAEAVTNGIAPATESRPAAERPAPEPGLIAAARDSGGGHGAAAVQGHAAPATGSANATAAATVANGPQAPVASPAWGRELGQQVATMAMRGGQQVELRLNPPDLGPLSVSLRVDDQGVQAQFLSAHAAVRNAVEQAMPQLRDALAEQGIALDEASVGEDRGRDAGERASGEAGDEPGEPATAPSIPEQADPSTVGGGADLPVGGVDLYA